MHSLFKSLSALALVSPLTVTATASPGTDRLVREVRTEAGWHGVEVNRIRRTGDALHVSGYDRAGRAVTLTMSCAQLGVDCASRTATRSVVRSTAAAAH